jgi:hypothetical protein
MAHTSPRGVPVGPLVADDPLGGLPPQLVKEVRRAMKGSDPRATVMSGKLPRR